MRLGMILAMCATGHAMAATCESLREVQLPHTTIRIAETVAAGEFTPPGERLTPQSAPQYKRIPAFCRVAAEISPVPDSNIKIEVWLPAANWNQKLQGEGNGGFAGSIAYNVMAAALAKGYAVTATDTGHQGRATDADWALHHPEKIVDFGHRGIHEMTEKAKLLVKAFYGDNPQRSYFVGCSDGGREALMEAQRYPGDYDGILAGAPANNWTHMLTASMDVAATLMKDDASFIPPAKVPAIAKAVLAACDAADGVTDGILNDPRQCRFDPAALLCKGAESDACLTAPQVKSLAKIYEGGRTAKGEQIFPGLLPGGEEGGGGWKNWVLGDGAAYMNGFFRNMVFDDPAWTFRSKPLQTAMQTADEKMAGPLNATDPNLSAFQKRGGKLIIYHGWNDPAISALNTIAYYNSVLAAMTPAQAQQVLRLYMVPGMQHCSGGPGPSLFGQFAQLPGDDPETNIYLALERWVEKNTAPGSIVAASYPGNGPRMTRPLCVYPESAKYKGSGDTNAAASFSCTR